MARDEMVQSAIDNWAPRFISNSIDANDFQRVTNTVERWDDWCRAWSECGALHAQMGEEAEGRGYYTSAGPHEHNVQYYQRALPYFDFPGEHVAIPYEGGATMYGIFRKPWHTPRPPVVILVPGLDSVKEELHVYGEDFLRRGMAVLAIDGPGQGEMEFEFPLRNDYEVPVRHAVDYLESRPDVDA